MLFPEAMLRMLSYNEDSINAQEKATGKTIAQLQIDNNKLQFLFDDCSGIKLYDSGQSCCEERYMHTDDDLDSFVGSTLQDIEILDGPEKHSNDMFTESEFLIITTSYGQFTVVNYNEHNGYYGGFNVVAEMINGL